jgi:hypothetical protein
MVRPEQISFGEVALLFICQEHSIFYSYRSNECSLFLLQCLAFIFCLDFCSDLLISLHQGVFDLWSMLVFIKRIVLKKFEWCWKREKVSCKKVVQKGACLDCGLGFCMSCLISF